MSIFNRKKDNNPYAMAHFEPLQPNTDQLRQSAIEYIVSLPKNDKDRFFEAVDLIWQGYNKLDRVKTIDERNTEREAKALGMTNDEADDLDFELLDEPITSPLAPTKALNAKDAK